MYPNKESNLYIWLGKDHLFYLNLNRLLFSEEVMPELEKVFSLRDIVGSDQYPSRMGLFVMDSKLHFLGGENLDPENSNSLDFEHYFNKKVFSFNLPSFTPDLSTPFPNHSGYKPRPFVFTISNKVYALATAPFYSHLGNIFEVFEPNTEEWRSLPLPPFPALYSIKSHCVVQNNLLLQTLEGDYIFDANEEMEKWMPFNKFRKSKVCALLEYKDHILVLTKDPFRLLAYELDSFYSSPKGVALDIDVNHSGFRKLSINWASFNIVEDNYICLVFISTHKIHVSVFRFITKDVTYGTYAHEEAYQEFDIPKECNPDFHFYSTFLLCTKDEENPTAVSQLDTNRDRYLYISLGYDNLFSLNFNELCSGEPKLDLKLLYTNCNRQEVELPVGMGLFFSDSKLHFLGGENFEVGPYEFSDQRRLQHFQHLQELMGLDVNRVRPKYGQQGHDSKTFKIKCGEEWINKKVLSYNLPDFTRVNSSTPIPNHSSCKFRPLVFTISNKVYALSSGPLSIRFPYVDQDVEKLKLFEVYDLVEKKWRDLKDPHPDLCKLIRTDTLSIRSQCVIRNKLLLQTDVGGDYLFDSDSGDWDRVDDVYPLIWASVEYNDEYLLILTRNTCDKLNVYELALFGKDNSISTKLYIYNNVRDFWRLSEGASLHLVDHNLVGLAFVTFDKKIHVMVFKVEIPLRYAVVEVHQIFDIPQEFHRFYLQLHSTFLWQSDVIQRDDTKRIQHDLE